MDQGHFFKRLQTPWMMSDTDKCLTLTLLVLVLAGPAAVFFAWVYPRNPAIAPYIDPTYFGAFRVFYLGWYGLWILVLLLCQGLRNTPRAARCLVYFVALLYGLGSTLITYYAGPFTTDSMGSVMLSGLVAGFLMLDRRPMLITLGIVLPLHAFLLWAPQAGLIPYGPLISAPPVVHHRLDPTWARHMALLFLPILVVMSGVVYFFFYRMRDREAALSRASTVIRRYVPTQVADAVLAGRDEAVNQHARRRLTLFFSDLVGFTEIAERMEPEDLSRVLNEYFTDMTAIAARHDGTVDELMGDAILILFGAPQATSDADHALRAVRMAIDMQRAVGALNARWHAAGIEESFRVRMGINTGVVTVGNFGSEGRMKYAALGKHVNLAARLQTSCEPGKVLLSHSTWLLVRDQIPCLQRGEVTLKGIQRPVMSYEIASAP